MKFKLLQSEKEYLVNKVLNDNIQILSVIQITETANKNYELYVEFEIIDEIRDVCSEKLQLIGFDKHYNLNEDGKMLEKLIDIFYVN